LGGGPPPITQIKKTPRLWGPPPPPPPHTHSLSLSLLQILQFYAWLTVCKWRHCVLVPGFCELRAGATAQRLQVHRGAVF
jgi:hypothetical protein